MDLIAHVVRALDAWDLGGVKHIEEYRYDGLAGQAFWVDTPTGRWLVKVAFDKPAFVLPGLAIAEKVGRHGVPTGPPLRTKEGELGQPIEGSAGTWTVAVLTPEPGEPIDLTAPKTHERLGELLARVHQILAASCVQADVPARLLDWWRGHATRLGDISTLALLDQLDRANVESIPNSVIYGDPSPEVLDHKGRLALIDWGTPSWGPQLHDIVCWSQHLVRGGASENARDLFLDSYAAIRPLTPLERELMESWHGLLPSITE